MKEVFPSNRNYFEAKPSKGATGLVAIDAANRVMEKIRKDSYVDSLTDCFNRNYLEKFIKEDFNADRDNNKLAFIFIDLNDLKNTNDTYGHTAGDKLLKDAAKFLKDNFRKDDTVVRIGGDEFIVICRNHSEDDNFQDILSEQLEESKSRQLEECQPGEPPIDFAFGVAVYNRETDFSSLDRTIARADQIMYERKLGMEEGEGERGIRSRSATPRFHDCDHSPHRKVALRSADVALRTFDIEGSNSLRQIKNYGR